MASPIPVLPDVPSMIVPPGLSRPAFSASSIMATAMRSLIEFPGLNVSIFANTSASISPRVIAWMRTGGVLPMASRIVSQTLLPEGLATRRSLQGEGGRGRGRADPLGPARHVEGARKKGRQSRPQADLSTNAEVVDHAR